MRPLAELISELWRTELARQFARAGTVRRTSTMEDRTCAKCGKPIIVTRWGNSFTTVVLEPDPAGKIVLADSLAHSVIAGDLFSQMVGNGERYSQHQCR